MLKLNIRQKIILGIVIFTTCFGCFGVLSYTNIEQLEREVLFVERADELSNLILEIRRVEKNYLLYRDSALFRQGVAYLNQATGLLQSLTPEIQQSDVKRHGVALENDLARYRTILDTLAKETALRETGVPSGASNLLREVGQALVENSRAIARYERASILSINDKLRTTLILSMAAVAVVVLVLVVFVVSSILKPLRQVQEAAGSIADGTFAPLAIKNAHDEIQQVFVALNSMVSQLVNRRNQLVQAQKLSSIGTLASGIAHQLNNPLNNISTSCQILMEQETRRDEFETRMLTNIDQETLRARDIVKGLLEFSREREYSPVPVSLAGVVRSSVRLVSSQVPSNIPITTDTPESIIIHADPHKMQEAFINLVINAVQAIEPKSGSIRISAAVDETDAMIAVSDTGMGMSPETLERVFDPFFSTKEVGAGTGLGLYIVYGIVEKHCGSIHVESAPGKGTTFFIKLPLAKESA
jgi:signal transduction histidine kinase